MRVTVVAKAQKAPGNCSRCGTEIAVGMPYHWIAFRHSGRRIRCAKPACRFRPSDMTTSDKLARLYSIQENLSDYVDNIERNWTLDDVNSELSDAASEAREVAEEYRESASNIESGFGTRTSVCDELEEKADSIDSWADELESCLSGLDDWDEDTALEDAEQEIDELDPTGQPAEDLRPMATDEESEARREAMVKERLEEKRTEWCDEVATTVNDTAGGLEL